MKLYQKLTRELWFEDVSYVLLLSLRGEIEATSLSHLNEYVKNRYHEDFRYQIVQMLISCQRWFARNWDNLTELGLIKDGGVVNGVLLALFDYIISDYETWSKIHELEFEAVLKKTQQYINEDTI